MGLNSPIKWHGGKHYLAKKIIELIPKDENGKQLNLNYCEPYAGSLAVLLEKDDWDGVNEIINDRNRYLTNFWCCLRNDSTFDIFKRYCDATEFSEKVFNEAAIEADVRYELAKSYNHNVKDVECAIRAWRFFVRCRLSREGKGKAFATPTYRRLRRGMNEQVSSFLTAIDSLEQVSKRLRRVMVFNQPAIGVITKFINTDTLFYLDPPYHPSTRETTEDYNSVWGDYEMSHEDHVRLLDLLGTIKHSNSNSCRFILSGYDCELYDKYRKKYSWEKVDIKTKSNASSAKQKPEKTESLWMNFCPS
jgi:DNA adenine methylase